MSRIEGHARSINELLDKKKFRENTRLPFKAKTEFRKADLDERQALYIQLASLCWSPDRLNET